MKPIPWDDEQHDQIREDAYWPEPAPNPQCALCGAEMAVKRFEPGATVWHCDGAVGWDKWGRMQLTPGRWRNDPHSVKSQIERRRR